MSLLKQQAVGAHIKRLRIGRRMSMRALAARTGFSASFMSQVENGQVSPSISSMEKLADALGVSLGEFFLAAALGRSGTIVRATSRTTIDSGWSNAQIEALSGRRQAQALEPVLITLGSHGRSGKHPYPHTVEEFAFVVRGCLSLTLGPEHHRLEAGDAVTILPQELRLWENEGDEPAQVLIVTLRTGVPATVPAPKP